MGLLEDFEAIDVDAIRRWVDTQQEEHLSLDFKRVNSTNLSDSNDREHFAKALSGFANADGGIVVWGVATDKMPRHGVQTEVASHIVEIPDVATFVGRLNEFTGSHVNPRVEGVRHRRLLIEGDSGLVVTLIPSSDGGPHMAKAGLDRYFRRHGDRFLPMEHFEIADMFGRRLRPELRVRIRLSARRGVRASSTDPKDRIEAILELTNIGRGTAQAPYLEVRAGMEIDRVGISGYGNHPLSEYRIALGRSRFISRTDFAIHPGVWFEFASLSTDVGHDNIPTTMLVEVDLAAIGSPLQTVRFALSPRKQLILLGRSLGDAPDDIPPESTDMSLDQTDWSVPSFA